MKISILVLSFFVLIIFGGCASNTDMRIDNLPMYGQPDVERSKELKRTDEDFIASAMREFTSKAEASQAWWMSTLNRNVRFPAK